jgi:hypothetical protein
MVRLARDRQAARNAEMRGSIRVLMGSGSVALKAGQLAQEAAYGVFAEYGERVARCRSLPGVREETAQPTPPESWEELLLRLTGKDVTRCPHCGDGYLRTTQWIKPGRVRRVEARAASP